MEAEGSSKGKQRVWTAEEDALLVDALLVLHEQGCLISDNGFKTGIFTQLQKMLTEKSPRCGIKADPHIRSRLKTLKVNWQALYDMVNGTNTSGFGWDPENHCVTAEKVVWDECIKSNKKASHLRGKTFPHFNALCTIFGKDRATGKGSISGLEGDQLDESEISPQLDAENIDDDVDFGEETEPSVAATIGEANTATTTSRKRRRNSSDRDELYMEGLEKIMTITCQGIQEATATLGSHVQKLARAAVLDKKRDSLYNELCNLKELSSHEIHDALFKINKDENTLAIFSSLPYEAKLEMVRRVLA
ncbi:uncharacterized protein At2g29880-like [Neltuma alba]|uniref:uncharacterized protein At2g29880-like n=1 Tax=Neltuma alba TaxID=207710 RepID=UPI0010A52305|nr:uncharacterized protein At2g29880-like [Prosopis alba]